MFGFDPGCMVEVAIIGGGVMGSYTARALAPHVDNVLVFDEKPINLGIDAPNVSFRDNYFHVMQGADFVLFCVPTESVIDTMTAVLPYCKDGAIVGGQTSRKAPEKQVFDDFVNVFPQKGLQYFSIHTM